MPFAVTHVLTTIIIIELIRDYFIKDKEHFPLYLVLFGGIIGLVPDLDFFLYYALYLITPISLSSIHRMYTHSVVWPFLSLIGAWWSYFANNKKLFYTFLVVSIGLTWHILLDIITGHTVALAPFIKAQIGFNLLPDEEWARAITLGIDAILLVGWLIYIEWRHKLSEFI